MRRAQAMIVEGPRNGSTLPTVVGEVIYVRVKRLTVGQHATGRSTSASERRWDDGHPLT